MKKGSAAKKTASFLLILSHIRNLWAHLGTQNRHLGRLEHKKRAFFYYKKDPCLTLTSYLRYFLDTL